MGNLHKSRKSWEQFLRIWGEGGVEPKGVGGIFQGGGTGGTDFGFGYVVDDPPHGLVPGGCSAQGRHTDHWW